MVKNYSRRDNYHQSTRRYYAAGDFVEIQADELATGLSDLIPSPGFETGGCRSELFWEVNDRRGERQTMLGKFIVFEGVEGCGKTTQLQRSQQWLQSSGWLDRLGRDRPLVITREPGGTALGASLRQLLLGHTTPEPIQDRAELLLYAADRAQHVAGVLRPALAAGSLILSDRYTDSTVAYQGYGRGLDLDLIHQLNAIATHGLESDLTLWLDLDAEVGLGRAQRRSRADRIEQSGLAFHQRVQQGFAALAIAHPHRIVTIDASLSPDAVAEQVQTVLTAKLEAWITG